MRAYHQRRRAEGRDLRAPVELVDYNRSTDGRAVKSLVKFLQWTPLPSPEKVDEWAAAVAQRLGVPVDRVRSAWRPVLDRRGVVSRATGRPLDEERCEFVRQRLAEHPDGRLPWGFWQELASAMNRSSRFGPRRVTKETARRWWDRHQRVCDARPDYTLRKWERRQAGAERRKVEGLLSTGEVAELLGVHRGTVLAWARDGAMASTLTAGGGERRQHRFERDEVERVRALLDERGRLHRADPRPLNPIEHGTDRGYNAHLRRGETPCEGCWRAHSDYMKGYRRSVRAAPREIDT